MEIRPSYCVSSLMDSPDLRTDLNPNIHIRLPTRDICSFLSTGTALDENIARCLVKASDCERLLLWNSWAPCGEQMCSRPSPAGSWCLCGEPSCYPSLSPMKNAHCAVNNSPTDCYSTSHPASTCLHGNVPGLYFFAWLETLRLCLLYLSKCL